MSQPDSNSERTSPATVLGFACLAATLLLTSPGVRVVRADEPVAAPAPLVSEAPPAASCDAVPVDPQASLTAIQQQVAGRAAVVLEADEAPGDFRMLNGRGYNYGPATDTPGP
jgi:hypothetical protein